MREGKGLPHAQAVADVLRRAGYDEGTQLLALLHDVVEDTPRTVDDIREAFGEPIAAKVGALTEDPRSGATRSASATCAPAASPPARPSSTSPWPTRSPRCDHALLTETPVSDRKLRHYTVTLQLALTAGLATACAGSSTS